MVAVRVYVEGGGESKVLRTMCRRAFSELFRKAGLAGTMPRVIASGSRRAAYEDFCTAMAQTPAICALLLVDSEAPVLTGDGPWDHLKKRPADQWSRPARATDDHCHLMVQCMESWFLADQATLAKYFGQGFHPGTLPKRQDIEAIPKDDVLTGLGNASRHTATKGKYSKGSHSFKILALLDPTRIRCASPWADRLLSSLATLGGASS